MNSKERVRLALEFKESDRIPKYDGFWEQTVDLYMESGLKNRLSENPTINIDGFERTIGNAMEDYFGFDIDVLYIDTSMRMPCEVISEEDEFITLKDRYGFTVKKFKDKSGSMHFIDHVTKDRDSWENLKYRMVFDKSDTSRIDSLSYFMHSGPYPSWDGFKQLYTEYRKRDKFLLYACYGAWEGTWRHRGFSELMMDSALDSEWVSDMLEYHSNLTIKTVQHAIDIGAKPDGIFIMEDLGGTHTTLISRESYQNLIKPSHIRIAEFCHSNDMKLFMHSCGKIDSFIPDFIEAGIDVLQAIQSNTGMDVVKLKKEYGNSIVFFGNISEAKLAGSKEDIKEEIKYKISNAKAGGGYIYHSDHSIPDEISFEAYEYAMKLVDEYGRYE